MGAWFLDAGLYLLGVVLISVVGLLLVRLWPWGDRGRERARGTVGGRRMGGVGDVLGSGRRWWALVIVVLLLAGAGVVIASRVVRPRSVAPTVGCLLGALLVSAGGVLLIRRGYRADPSRGRPRCPQCWYDMRGHVAHAPGVSGATGGTSGVQMEGLACPECGYEIADAQELYRARPRPWMVMLGACVVALAWAAWAVIGARGILNYEWAWLGTVLGYGVAVAGLVVSPPLVWWGFYGDRSKGRARCPKCWYDMRGTVPKLVCPECGRLVAWVHYRQLSAALGWGGEISPQRTQRAQRRRR